MEDPKLTVFKAGIEAYADFPKKGILFQDIFGAMKKPESFQALMELVKENAQKMSGQVDCIVGLDARGFLFGPIMALELKVPFVPVILIRAE
jgi:adenine phosphoribosyltransferase